MHIATIFGLEKVKERIIEYLIVQQRLGVPKGQVLCLVGPPGVGKTSLTKSIARVTQRSFVRLSLGGVHDEAEIRGHRRTYIGAMPGKIVQNMKKAKTTNPLFLLDELDKMGADWRGDPASAMLEVLDPEQNNSFNDHYLEVNYDLSNVMFIATANTLNLPRPLLDRLEIIRLEGYTEDEKVQIGVRHLVEKQKKEHGLKTGEVDISEGIVRLIVQRYTREAGVRQLEREIATLCRKALKELIDTKAKKVQILPERLEKYLGIPSYEFEEKDKESQVGIATGLAWTEVGGDILFIEVVKSEGKGKVTITGKLGEVMQESVQAALSYIKSRARELGVDPSVFLRTDIHIHVPEGAIPKDGPSAGIAMCTSILSVFLGVPIKSTVAMTGEIRLAGRVLPIGGLKEKLLAAQRAGITTVIIPKRNAKDLADLPQKIKDQLEIIPVETMDQVLAIALDRPLKPVELAASDLAPVDKPAKEIETLQPALTSFQVDNPVAPPASH